MKFYEKECLSEKQVLALGADLKKYNEDITETAGFVPLEVKLRRFQETGQIMQFSTSEFTSSDLREMYLAPDMEITPEMDFEEIIEVQERRRQFVEELRDKKAGTSEPEKEEVESQEPEKKAETEK